jgi:hypothetical protein
LTTPPAAFETSDRAMQLQTGRARPNYIHFDRVRRIRYKAVAYTRSFFWQGNLFGTRPFLSRLRRQIDAGGHVPVWMQRPLRALRSSPGGCGLPCRARLL